MDANGDRQIVPGITMGPSGQATIAPAITNVLFDLAVELEGPTALPVDVQHVVAAIVLAEQNGEIHRHTKLAADDPALRRILSRHVEALFANYGGKLGEED